MSYLEKLFGLENKVAVVTGGNGQLGTEYVKALLGAGARVAVFDISEDLNEQLKSLEGLKYCQVDITKPESLKSGLEAPSLSKGTLWKSGSK